MSPTQTHLGLYLHEGTYALARSAYLADFANRDHEAPTGFDHWIEDALRRYIARPLADRQRAHELALQPDPEPATVPEPDRPRPAGRRLVKVRISQATSDQLDDALRDAEASGLLSGRSPLTVEAIRCAIGDARTRNGGSLPPPPAGRLPIRRRTRGVDD